MESLKSEMRSNENVIEHFTQLVVLSAIILIRRSETSFRQYLSSGNSVFLGEDIGREFSRQLILREHLLVYRMTIPVAVGRNGLGFLDIPSSCLGKG